MATTKKVLSTVTIVAVLGAVTAMAWPDRPADASGSPDLATGDGIVSGDDSTETPMVTVEGNLIVLEEESLDETARQNSILLPSGQRLPALNGCVNTDRLALGGYTKSPVKRLVHGKVYDYYEHEDGSCTTTQNVIDPNTGKLGAAGMHWRELPGAAPEFQTKTSNDYRLDQARTRPAQPGSRRR